MEDLLEKFKQEIRNYIPKIMEGDYDAERISNALNKLEDQFRVVRSLISLRENEDKK